MAGRYKIRDGFVVDTQTDKVIGSAKDPGAYALLDGDESAPSDVKLVKPSPKPTTSVGTPPSPPNTKGMSLAQAAAANAAYKKQVDAYLAKQAPAAFTAKTQSSELKKKEKE